ncbi:MAG: hypothetical protein VKM97_07390 [Cyanobacteriota bacterium]|nr:hypothetical protein [Cyanobacteriota bacterium]
MCSLYTNSPRLRCAPHIMLSLILHNTVHLDKQVREDALHMLHVLSHKEWQATTLLPGRTSQAGGGGGGGGAASAGAGGMAGSGEGGPGDFALGGGGGGGGQGGGGGSSSSTAVVVLGNLQDSYQQFQFQVCEGDGTRVVAVAGCWVRQGGRDGGARHSDCATINRRHHIRTHISRRVSICQASTFCSSTEHPLQKRFEQHKYSMSTARSRPSVYSEAFTYQFPTTLR